MKKVFKKLTVVLVSVVIAAVATIALVGCPSGLGNIVSVEVHIAPIRGAVVVGEVPSLEGGYFRVVHQRGERIVSMTDENVVYTATATTMVSRDSFFVTAYYEGHQVQVEFAEVLDEVDGMVLTWSDEFLGNEINPNNWEFQHGTGSQGPANPWGNRELQFYRGENASLQDGYLVINGRQENVIFRWLGGGVSEEIYVTQLPLDHIDFAATYELYSQGITFEDVRVLRRESLPGVGWLSNQVGGIYMAEYTSTRMRTHERFYQTFGRFEARMSIPAFPGSWNAFWMMPENNLFPTGGNWPRSGEIDIMENRGSNPTYVGQAVHFAVGNPGQHRMLFNQDSNQQRLRACPDGVRGFTTHGEYYLFAYEPGMQYDVRFNAHQVGVWKDYHFHTYRIDWRPEHMIWYIGYYGDCGDKIWHEVYRIENWRLPSGTDGGWTGWSAGPANMIPGIPTEGSISGGSIGATNTAYLLTRRASAPFDHNFHLILNMAIGGMFDSGNVWNIPQGLDVHTRVDYVRAWQFTDLIPQEATVTTTPTGDSQAGSRPNLAGGEIEFMIYSNGQLVPYTVVTNDPRLITYPRILDTVGYNVVIYVDFRGKKVPITLPRVL